MANPIFGRGERFTEVGQNLYSQQPGYQQSAFNQATAYAVPGYQQQYQPYGQQPFQQTPTDAVMTYDDVIAKTGLSLSIVFLVAAAAFMFVPTQMLMPLWIGAAVLSLVTVFIVSLRRNVGPIGLGLYALFEGAFVGALSKYFDMLWPGIVLTAVLATFVTAGITLAVMKIGKIRVSAKFKQMVVIATFGFFVAMLVNFLLSMFGINTGLRDLGPGAGLLAIGISLLAICLAVFNLVMDFDAVRVGVENRAPASESWRAALGITVTMVWLYIEILRILSYFRE